MLLVVFAHLVSVTIWRPMLTSRAMLRSRWKQEFEHQMRQLPLDSFKRDGDHGFYSERVRKHGSLVIRALISERDDGSMYHDPIDVFVEFYLKQVLSMDQLGKLYFTNVRRSVELQEEHESRFNYKYHES